MKIYQNFFEENTDILGEYNISDLFGDAKIEEGQLVGDIGLQTGMRIVMNLPSVGEIEGNVSFEDKQFSLLEKAYYIRGRRYPFSIPVVSSEVEIIDTKIKDLDLESIYDVDCLARKMTNSEDYSMLFKKIIPIQAVSSMILQYVNFFFLDSIGVASGERAEEVDSPKRIEMPSFNGTNLTIRKYFACFYNSNRGLHFENFKIPRIEFPDFWKMIFGSINFPEINLNLILNFDLNFGHKVC